MPTTQSLMCVLRRARSETLKIDGHTKVYVLTLSNVHHPCISPHFYKGE